MFKKTLLVLAALGLFATAFSTEAQAGNRNNRRYPVLRALAEASREAQANPTFNQPKVPTWGYRYQPPSYGWSYRPDTGWGFYHSGGTWGWGFGY